MLVGGPSPLCSSPDFAVSSSALYLSSTPSGPLPAKLSDQKETTSSWNCSSKPSPEIFILKDIYIYFLLINLFIYFWLCWVFVSVRGLSLVAASGGHSSSRCTGVSLSRPLLLWSTGSRRTGSVVVAHGLSCSAACGIFPDQGSNPCPLHWQADSQPLHHQGSPRIYFKWRKHITACMKMLTGSTVVKAKN